MIIWSAIDDFFNKPVEWPDEDFGGPLQAVSLRAYRKFHSQWKSDIDTGPSGHSTGRSSAYMHINPGATAYCTAHSIYVAKELEKRGIDYDFVILTDTENELRAPHSAIRVGIDYIELNQREPYPAKEYKRFWATERNIGHVRGENIHGVLTALGYTYK